MKKFLTTLMLTAMLFVGCTNPVSFDNAEITCDKVRDVVIEQDYAYLHGLYKVDDFNNPYIQLCEFIPENFDKCCLEFNYKDEDLVPGDSIITYGYFDDACMCHLGPVFVVSWYITQP